MRFITWNVNGYNACYKNGYFTKIFSIDPDIICLQEIKLSRGNELYNFDTINYMNYYSLSRNKGKSGVTVYAKETPIKVYKNIEYTRFDNDGRVLILEYNDFFVMNVYMPHGGRDKKDLEFKMESYKHLLIFLEKYKNQNLLLMGDFNIAKEDIDLARPNANKENIMFTDNEREAINRFNEIGFVDAFRNDNKETVQYTWWPYAYTARNRNIGWRIDYIFLSQNLSKREYNVKILDSFFGSDHCPICIDIDI